MSPPKNAISCSPGEQRKSKAVIHGANNVSSPRELVHRSLVRPVNNKSMTNSPRELVTLLFRQLVVRPVNTLKGLPGGARFLLPSSTALTLLASASGCTSFEGLQPERRELHGAHPLRALHRLRHSHPCDFQRSGKAGPPSRAGLRPGRPSAAGRVARCAARDAPTSAVRRCVQPAQASARGGT